MRWLATSLFTMGLSAAAATAQAAESPQVQRGRVLAQANCASCHAVGRTGGSPLKIAPPFRELHERFDVEDLQESLAEGIMPGHPTMPQFRFDPGQVTDFIAYLKSLEN